MTIRLLLFFQRIFSNFSIEKDSICDIHFGILCILRDGKSQGKIDNFDEKYDLFHENFDFWAQRPGSHGKDRVRYNFSRSVQFNGHLLLNPHIPLES